MLGVSPESYRTWDAGRRATPPKILARARALATHRDEQALLPLPVLALLIGVHVKTLRAAARDGRLPVTYDTRTTFRRLRARATPVSGRHSAIVGALNSHAHRQLRTDPFLHRAGFTACRLSSVCPVKGAQRLSATLMDSPPVCAGIVLRVTACSTPFGDIDGFTFRYAAYSASICACSTPFGDIDGFTPRLAKPDHTWPSKPSFHACGSRIPYGASRRCGSE